MDRGEIMSNFFEESKKVLEKLAVKIADRAGEFTKDAAVKAEEVTKLGKVKLDLFQLKREKEKEFETLGEKVFDLIQDSKKKKIKEDKDVLNCVDKILELNTQFEEKEKKYNEIKKQSADKGKNKQESSDTKN